MQAFRTVTVRPVVPSPLAKLGELSRNWHWSWSRTAGPLFASIDPALWDRVDRNPVRLLDEVSQARLDELASDAAFVARVDEEHARLESALEAPAWYGTLQDAPRHIAYFSPEFGVDGSLPQYSGGLGILAGDHLKSASDLGVPLTGVGLFYRAGYFRQSIGDDGWQREAYPPLDPASLGLTALTDAAGAPVEVSLALPDGRSLHAAVWIAWIGRVPLLLLDSDTASNDASLRGVTDRLYGGGGEHRLLQELLLGVGGVRAVRAFAAATGRAQPDVFHTNEGHAGFQGLERIGELVQHDDLAFDQALTQVRASTVFTTHTPVPAGIDRFEVPLVSRYLRAGLIPGLDADRALALGQESYEGGDPTVFNMAVLGLRLGQRANGVSLLHGRVSREMFRQLWPGLDADDVPITSITNGVHAPTWVHPYLKNVSDHAFGDGDTTAHDWTDANAVSDEQLWAARLAMKKELVAEARRRVGGVSAGSLLDPEVLTIGFARRVPTYKRLTLMLRDPERLTRLLTDPERPVQIVVAGKSHPADDAGKQLIQQLVRFSRDPRVRGRIVFLPDYDITLAKTLYPGCDVWLNNPLRPLEACGTSGMKAALNGALNLSIMDGWWDEWFDGENGWAIPSADTASNDDERDELEASAMYEIVEQQLVPRFYHHRNGVPRRWLQMVRHTMTDLGQRANSDRMVREYVERLYVPAARTARALEADGFACARELAAYVDRVRAAWSDVRIADFAVDGVAAQAEVGDVLRARAVVELGGLDAEEVSVELVTGPADANGAITEQSTMRMRPAGAPADDGGIAFAVEQPLTTTGTLGYSVRVTPAHDRLASATELGLVTTPA